MTRFRTQAIAQAFARNEPRSGLTRTAQSQYGLRHGFAMRMFDRGVWASRTLAICWPTMLGEQVRLSAAGPDKLRGEVVCRLQSVKTERRTS